MRRREILGALGGAVLAWPLSAVAQQGKPMRRIGVLLGVPENSRDGQVWLSAFLQTLAPLGWKNGGNVRVETRWTGADINRVKANASELISLKPDVILCVGTLAISALLQETRSIPIIFVNVTDPVGSGFVASMARPGGNATGLTNYEASVGGKWVATLKEIVPSLDQLAVLMNPDNPGHTNMMRTIQTSASSLSIQTISAFVRSREEIEVRISAMGPVPKGGLVVLPDTITAANSNRIIELAAQHRVPAIYPYSYWSGDGGLVSYGPDQTDFYRRAAPYVDRILRGANPADLPVQSPTKFELVINMKTAKALGLNVPLSLQQLADEVIE